MSLATNLQDLATRVATEVKSHRTLINGNVADLSALTTTAKSNLVAAVNELDAAVEALAGGNTPTTLDELTDVDTTGAATGHVIRFNGTTWVSVDGGTYFQPVDSDLAAISALTTAPYGRDLLTLANQAALMGLLVAASETVAGKVELATAAETVTGTDNTRATHPAGVKSAIDAAISAAAGSYQPADADLTAIAAVTTTAYGRALLALADQAALKGLLPTASETATGLVELATTAEATAGTDTARAVTAAGVKAVVDAATNALIDSAPGTLDTLNELAAALGDDPNFATTITTALANRVRTDTAAQGLNSTQQANARTNIDVYSKTEIGDPTTNFVTTFEAGLA